MMWLTRCRDIGSALCALLLVSTTALGQGAAERIVREGIAAGGGARALEAARALEWTASASIFVNGQTITIRGVWRVRPDTAVSRSWLISQDSTRSRSIVLAGDSAWLVRGAEVNPMPAALRAEERQQFRVYALMRLVSVLDQPNTIALAEPDSAGHVGVVVSHPSFPDATLYFDSSRRLTRIVTRFARPDGAQGDSQEVRLADAFAVRGARWFRTVSIARAGAPYFVMRIDSVRVVETPAIEWLRTAGIGPTSPR